MSADLAEAYRLPSLARTAAKYAAAPLSRLVSRRKACCGRKGSLLPASAALNATYNT